jgi:hypothetical protein
MACQHTTYKTFVDTQNGYSVITSDEINHEEFVNFFKENKEMFLKFFIDDETNGKLLYFFSCLRSALWRLYEDLESGNGFIHTLKLPQLKLLIKLFAFSTDLIDESEVSSIRICAFPSEICSKQHDHSHTSKFHHIDKNIVNIGYCLSNAVINAFKHS